MKKIILFTDCLGAGGAQRQLVGLAIMLKDAGYEVTVATYYDIDFYKYRLDENGVRNILIPQANNILKRIMAVRSFFKKERPDCVIAYQETPSLVACVCKILGCKYKLIVSERNTTQFVNTKDKIRFWLYRFANHIVPNSYAQGEFIANNYGNLKQRINVIHNFVDLTKFHPSYHNRRRAPLILVVASIIESKNALNLIKTAAILRRNGFSFEIHWYGLLNSMTQNQACYINKCKQLIQELNVNDNA